MNVDVKLINTIDMIDNMKILLPNSVSVIESEIVITDSGNNRICVLNDNEGYCVGGTFGLGKYKFKEPVYSTISNNFLFVCDWHNHRIVIYKNKKFYHQIGLFGKINNSRILNFLRLIKSLKSNGSFTYSHFSNNNQKNNQDGKSYMTEIKNMFNGIIYYLFYPHILYENLFRNIFINKPNGCVLIDDLLFFTQKNNYCITKYDINTNKVIKQIDNTFNDINFGRLGQITEFENQIYACDETNNKVWIFDINLKLIKYISITNYNIFSIAINKNYIVTCGVTSFSVFDSNYNLLFEKNGDGEYHGACLDNDYFYIANRLKHRIEKYEIKNKESKL